MKESKINVIGTIIKSHANGNFDVLITLGKKGEEEEHEIKGYLAGKLRQKYIRIGDGDKVEVELSSYDLTKGRITRRLK